MRRVTASAPVTLAELRQMLDDPPLRQSPARLREVARAREVVADFFAGPNEYQSTAASLQKYFDAYVRR